MAVNPCRSCPLKDGDKNNADCLRCRLRLAYVRRLTRELEFSACHPAEHVHRLHLPRV